LGEEGEAGMEKVKWKVGKVIDAHSHYRGREPVEHYLKIIELAGYTKVCLLGGTVQGGSAFELKKKQPGQFYNFAQVEHDPAKVKLGDGAYLVKQVEQLMDMGFDGLKMMEGKPAYRKESKKVGADFMPLALDHRYFHPFWEYLQDRSIPITMHLADPVDWWKGEDPKTAMYRGMEPQEEYFRQAISFMYRYPRLRMTFAHFMFMGPQLDRLGDLFSRFQLMRVDMAMADEYLYYMSDNPEKSRDFCIKWQDRILYGTDISDHNSLRHGRSKAEILRLFLETDETFVNIVQEAMNMQPKRGSNGRLEMHGLNLPVDVLEKILALNFEEFAGKEPKAVAKRP
jgi:predicted TIM-barrel fold metal-dependent hydrolase